MRKQAITARQKEAKKGRKRKKGRNVERKKKEGR
jgi:hypothetical protein